MQLKQRLALQYIRTKFKILSSFSDRKAAEKAFELFCTPQQRNKKPLPPIFEEAEKLNFKFEGNTVRGYRWHHPSQKKVLILHGFESSAINFDGYIKPLIKKGYEVLAFDAPAHGRSTGKSINVLTYKNLIHYINQHYGPVTSFIAHSFGGLSLSLAIEEMHHDRLFKLVLIAPAVETKTAIDHFFSLLHFSGNLRKEFDEVIRKMAGHPPEWYSVARAANNIKAEVLFLQDKDDHMTPLSDVEPIIEKKWPDFHFIITEGLGHRRIYRDQKIKERVLEFLT